IGTGRGIQRLRRSTHELESLGVDGAPMEWINDLAFGASGDLWAAAVTGVARVPLEPLAPRGTVPSVRFTRCSVAGADVPLPAGGSLEGPDIDVASEDSRITVEYVAVDPIHGQDLLYQSRLEGLDHDWSDPERGLSAHFGQLAPGAYRLLVRAV